MSGQLKIFLHGATGQTGQPLLRKCLERGHLVVAVIRTAASLAVEHENLRIEVADIFSCESLTPIFRGQDLVISALGFPKQLDEKMKKFTESMAAVLEAMREARLGRIITMSAWYTNPLTRTGQLMFDTMWSKVPGLVNTLDNEGEMDLMLARTEETISFTSVLVPSLCWDPPTTRQILVSPGKTWVEGAAGLMSREGNDQFFPFIFISSFFADVARFLLSVAESDRSGRWNRVGVAVTTEYSPEEEAQGFHRLRAQMEKHINQ